MTKEDKIFIECSCGGHVVMVGHLSHDNGGYECDHIDLAMYSYSGYDKRRFWKRIKIAFKFLITGKIFSDQITLYKEEAKRLSDFINKNINPDNK